jgi:hypothetical protein
MSFTFQNLVGLKNKVAIQGDRANQNPTVYQVNNFLADGDVKVGSFVWRASDTPETQVTNVGSTAIAICGFVERTINHNNYAVNVAGDMTISDGDAVTVARKGDFFVESDGAVSIGDTVYADTTDGSVTFTSGANNVDSGFKAQTSASASGEMVIISNWE